MQDKIVALSQRFHNCAVENRVNVIFWVKAFFFSSQHFYPSTERLKKKEKKQGKVEEIIRKIIMLRFVYLAEEEKSFSLKTY
jgi:hypothetical protein